ncbi:hypothetical protein [Actinosynnema mirum]|uniref:Head-to-tail adaptor n=1 Tax=Actinosynnema mirum (strain ATCC 29888 / DSM 43827 / JCM 3225 / NBRC 14064 / NCIMB 13271 / NRRL B-12336 / IMRU 3971 / 101) TaxID=446462 RepID=C6W8R4_ACTMD|nr:hypothetical protein [Actinosynnema mirum]ACU37163.1 hypothetical protein Amir_3256 [Actinosynnema mirum DSM 43827]
MTSPEPTPLATVADVQARTEVELTEEQRARAAVLIADASAVARARVPELPAPPPATAPGVIATAVLRALAAPPDGNRSETVGAHSRVAAHDGGGLYLTEDELELLRPPLPAPRGAFSIWPG